MKTLIVSIFLFAGIGLFAQEQKLSQSPKVQLGFGMNVSLEGLDKTIAEEVGVSSTGFTLVDFRGRVNAFKYLIIDAGLSVSQFKDELPFSEAVVFTSGQLSGLPSNATSKITSGSFYYSIGGKVPLTTRLHASASVGQRRFSASRGIPKCTDCMKTEIDLKAGAFAQGGFAWVSFNEDGNPAGEFDLLYTHYFNGGFQRTITLGFIAYF